jgi:hypothetical protein
MISLMIMGIILLVLTRNQITTIKDEIMLAPK